MPVKILMPALSPTMTEGNLAKWNKSEGDRIEAGEVIAEIETDKATMEVEAVDEGILRRIIVKEGSADVAVNSVIAVIAEADEDDAEVQKFIEAVIAESKTGAQKATSDQESVEQNKESLAANTADAMSTPTPTPTSTFSSPSSAQQRQNRASGNSNLGGQGRIFVSPLAKRIASLEMVNLRDVQGSGPHGRIIKADILDFLSSGGAKGVIRRSSEEFVLQTNSNMRKVIAKRLLESKNTVPHFYLNLDCKMDALLEVRNQINDSLVTQAKKMTQDGQEQNPVKLSVNDFIIMASAKALKEVPEANSSWGNDAIKMYNNVDVSVAVAIDGGLITPVIKNADQKDIITISKEMKDLATRARAGKLVPEEYQGGGFSISNLGMYGIKNFNAIINPPQSCILAVGASFKIPVVAGDKIEIATIMNASLSCDHRVVDGAVGANFLASFKKYIESPILMFV